MSQWLIVLLDAFFGEKFKGIFLNALNNRVVLAADKLLDTLADMAREGTLPEPLKPYADVLVLLDTVVDRVDGDTKG